MSRILITGANGLTGRRLAALLSSHHEVTAIVRTLPANPLESVTYHQIDLSRPWDCSALPARMDAVFHLAQPSNMNNFPISALSTHWVNAGSTAILLDYANRAKTSNFVLASTGGLCGSQREPIGEDGPLDPPQGPLNYYFCTKFCAEMLAQAYRTCFAVTVVRPFFIYGPGQTKDRLIQRIVHSVQSQLAVRVVGERGTEMNPVYVDDAVAGLAATLGQTVSQVINLAGPEVVSVRDITERIAALLQRSPSFIHDPGSPDRFVADVSRFEQLLKRPLLSFDAGIQITLREGTYV